MKRLGFIVMILLMYPVAAANYGPVTYDDSGMRITVQLTASESWTSPFEEDVNVTVEVVPLLPEIIRFNVTKITLMIINDLGSDNTELLAGDIVTFTPALEGTTNITTAADFHLTGSDVGTQCYFAIEVTGFYNNGTHTVYFKALSPSNLIGPFGILRSLNSPVSIVGIAVMILSVVCVAAGIYGVKKAKAPTHKRRTLLDDE